MFFWSFLLRIQVTGEHDCLGPFPGWLSGPPMDHNSLAPLPSGKGWLLCCFGVKGAWPSSEGINSVLRFRSVNNETGPLAIVSNLATCPSEEKEPIYNAMVIPRYNPCEPFKQNGCTVTSPGPSHKGCKANHGFPAVKGHGGVHPRSCRAWDGCTPSAALASLVMSAIVPFWRNQDSRTCALWFSNHYHSA